MRIAPQHQQGRRDQELRWAQPGTDWEDTARFTPFWQRARSSGIHPPFPMLSYYCSAPHLLANIPSAFGIYAEINERHTGTKERTWTCGPGLHF